MKKIICITLIAVILVNLISCGVQDSGDDTTYVKATPEEIEAFVDDREKAITICLPSYIALDDLNTKAVNKYLYELGTDYRVEFEYLECPWDGSFEGLLFPYLDSGAKPDMFYIFESPMYDERIENYALKLEGYLQSEEGKTLRESIPEYVWETNSSTGGLYGIKSYYRIYTAPSYIVNKSLMEKYDFSEEDLQVPLDELYDVLNEVKEKENITPFLVEDLSPSSDGYYVVENVLYIDRETLEVSYYFDTKENIVLFDTMEKYKNEGLLNQVSFENINYDDWFMFYLNDYGPYISKARDYLLNEDGEVAENEEDYVVIPTSEEIYIDYPTSTGLAVNKDARYKEESLDFLTKVFSDKTLNEYMSHGVENAHYIRDDNGRILPIYDESSAVYENLTYTYRMFLNNAHLSTVMYYEMDNKAEIYEDLAEHVKVSQFVDFEIHNKMDKEITEKIKKQSALAYYEFLHYFYETELEPLDSINETIERTDLSLGVVLSILSGHSMIFFGGFANEDIVTKAREALDKAGCQELISNIESIMGENHEEN